MQTPQQSAPQAVLIQPLFMPRVIAGLLQGIVLYWLLNAANRHSGISHSPFIFVPLLLVSLSIPLLFIVGLHRMPTKRLAMWIVLFTAIVAILGLHDAWRSMNLASDTAASLTQAQILLPSFAVTFCSAATVFMAFCLVLAGETSRSWFAPYVAYFELSWKFGLQLYLAATFVGALFIVLWLGAALFLLLKLHFFEQLLIEPWFNVPVSAVALAAAMHITDVRPEIIRGSRTLVLSLLSWLLLVLVVIVGGFLATLPFTGLGLLWATRSATWIMLGVAAVTILLVNAVFKSGAAADTPPKILRFCMRIACLTLPVLVTLSAYALALRIGQYGLTPRRVLACAATVVAACYAIGYTWAALSRQDNLAQIAPVNVITTWATVAVIIALFTPLADPARLAVNSQVKHLLAGDIDPEKFDYAFLQRRSARYGTQALARLQQENTGPSASRIRELSAQAAHASNETMHIAEETHPTGEILARNLISHSAGHPIPASFLSKDWRHAKQRLALPGCLNTSTMICDAYLVDLSGDHHANVVLFPKGISIGFVFDQSDDGDWHLVGRFSIAPGCASVREALGQGTFQLLQPRLKDIQIHGQRIAVEATPEHTSRCSG